MFSLNFSGKDEIGRKVFYNKNKYTEKEGNSMNIYDRKILMVDDNQELVVMIRRILEQSGYKNVVSAHSVAEGFRIFKEEKPELVILDVMLPDGDGFSLFCKMREISSVPILFLSAKDEDQDRLFGLGLGADDYITKPFLPQELILRVGAILKRAYQFSGKKEETVLRLGERIVDFDRASVSCHGEETFFTAKELALLKKLCENRGKIVTFDALCYAAWGDSYYGYENTLMVHIRHLREKIEEEPSSPKWILTVRGIGYRLSAEEAGKRP